MYARVQRSNVRNVLNVLLIVAAPCMTLLVLMPLTIHAQPTGPGQFPGQQGQVDNTPPAQSTPSDPPAAQGALLRDGIFGCNASKYANIGTLTAVGGIYVPVNDAAVTVNTGYLVYKECILDGVVAKISEAARTDLAGSILRQITTARQGQAQYSQKFWPERDAIKDKVTLVIADEAVSGVICPAFKKNVVTIEVRRYLAERNTPNQAFACSFPTSAGDHEAALRGETSPENVLEAIGAFTRPGNDPYTADLLYHEFSDSARAAALYAQEKQLDWGNGFYSVTNNPDNPFDEEIFTPGYLVSQSAGQAVTSGFRCLEGADELSEVCAPMFSGLSTQIISDARGLTGLSQSQTASRRT